MSKSSKWPILGLKIFLILMVGGILIEILPLFETEDYLVEADLTNPSLDLPEISSLAILEENSLTQLSNPANPETINRIKILLTAYSSTPCQTDDDPFITAAGTQVEDGIVANNKYSFGTKIRFPEIFGDKVFVVEDRMHWTKGQYQFDIWMDSYEGAKEFGAKVTEAEILED